MTDQAEAVPDRPDVEAFRLVAVRHGVRKASVGAVTIDLSAAIVALADYILLAEARTPAQEGSLGETGLPDDVRAAAIESVHRAWIDCGNTGWAHNDGRPCAMWQHANVARKWVALTPASPIPFEYGGALYNPSPSERIVAALEAEFGTDLDQAWPADEVLAVARRAFAIPYPSEPPGPHAWCESCGYAHPIKDPDCIDLRLTPASSSPQPPLRSTVQTTCGYCGHAFHERLCRDCSCSPIPYPSEPVPREGLG